MQRIFIYRGDRLEHYANNINRKNVMSDKSYLDFVHFLRKSEHQTLFHMKK
jgi:hypothetical protein